MSDRKYTAPRGRYLCPSCGDRFETYVALDQHFEDNPDCKDVAACMLKIINKGVENAKED